MVGITIGSMAVVLLISIAVGVQEDITGQIRDIGVNVLVVVPGRIESGTFNPNLAGQSFLSEEDAKRIAKVEGVVRAAPFTFVGGGIRNGEKVANPVLVATTPDWFLMHKAKMQAGHTLEQSDDNRDACVIGSVAKTELFGSASAIGKTVTINKRTYEVVGVTQDKKAEASLFSMGSLQNVVYISYSRLKTVTKDLQTHRIMIQIEPTVEPKALIKKLDGVLEQTLDKQQFQVLTQEDLLGLVYKLVGILTWLVTGLTSIALFVGGVGIMTVMLMAVSERAKEIGIRKTVGATQRDIFLQFLAEAWLLSAIGGCVGLIASLVICRTLSWLTPIKPMVTPAIVLLSFGMSGGVGMVFGLLPAVRAAKKDPVESIRNEN